MADSMASPQNQNTGMQHQTTSVTIVETDSEQSQELATLRLRLKKPATDKKVQWTTGTVDNEHMNKKKSKCCCVYTKPRSVDEDSDSSSSESDDECETCKGHIKKKKRHSHDQCDHEHPANVQPMPVDNQGPVTSNTEENDVSNTENEAGISGKND